MDIGNKIRSARIEAKFTQEKAAELLSVSRQTISNWENEKTYPDIISVVKISDLYEVSLDHLLKEEKTMSNYLDFLEKSTNVVESKNKLSKMIIISAYLIVWAISLIAFWFFIDDFQALGYSIMYLMILLPVTTFIVSILIGRNNYWGKLKWLAPLVLGIMYMLAEYSTFSAANMAEFQKINLPNFEMIFIGAGVSIVGIVIGMAIRKYVKE